MLRLSADCVVIAIEAEYVSAVCLRGRKRERIASARFPLTLREGVPALDELDNWLTDSAVSGAKQIEVIVSNAWVRYEILPWQQNLLDDALSLDYARALLTEQYGEVVNQWTLALSPAKLKQNRLVSGMDSRWLAALEDLAKRHAMKLTSVRPLLVAVFNKLAKELPDSSLLALVEPGRLCLLLMRDGEWHSLQNRVLPEPWERKLPPMIAQASMALFAADEPLFITAPAHRRTSLDDVAGTWLKLPAQKGFDPRQDREWAFCLGC
ncbi:hypothetical protein HNQ59_003658 [Chitinivorax tropicus]|uniref:Uncharacterized protein n=1 Tax=Chitinivorax tropicus TaxID=714531 RepID=A0A840MTC8_9PROT|nr:hypothetical protein [Chitinivorax tropicus]MBB5020339.1 hypothetical protein [Chitinivorax tropicus]